MTAGHSVTYLTRTQWPADAPPAIPGVEVVSVAPASELYGADGSRRLAPALAFTAGVLRHLATHRSAYDVVQVSQTPPMLVPATRLALLGSGVPVGVDWFEVWSAAYWRRYLGPVGGTLGAVLQRLATTLSPRAFAHGRLTAQRLPAAGVRSRRTVLLPGLIRQSDPVEPVLTPPPTPHVTFVGRHIPEKGVTSVPAAVAEARRTLPDLRATILGDGPSRPDVQAEIARLGLDDVVDLPGFVPQEELTRLLGASTALLFPSEREGYGLVVVEASALGTPTVVVDFPDNASVDLVSEGENGFVVADREPASLAAAVLAAHAGGAALRGRTAAWFAANAEERSVARSAQVILDSFAGTAR